MAADAKSAAAQARAVKGRWMELKSTSPFVSMSMRYTEPESSESRYASKSHATPSPPPPRPANIAVALASLSPRVARGKAKTILDCSAAEAFKHQFAACGREKMRISKKGGDRARFIIKAHTKHDFELASVKTMPFPLANREFLSRYLCLKEITGDLVLVFEALPDRTEVDYGANLKVVRAKSTGVVRFKPINDDAQCEVTLIQHGDAGGFVPERVMVAKIPRALSGVAEMRELFQRDDAIDGAKRSELAAVIGCVLPGGGGAGGGGGAPGGPGAGGGGPGAGVGRRGGRT
jgi:hypothetical protein